MKRLLIVAVASPAFMSVDAASGQTTPPFTYTSTGVESAWTHADAWDCVDDLNRPCSGQPAFPQDEDHMVVIKNAVILDLNGQNLEIGQMDIVEDGTTGSLTVENTGGGSPRLIVNESGLLSGAVRVADGSSLTVECGAGMEIDDDLTVEPGGDVFIYGAGLVEGDVFIGADSNLQADRGLVSVQGDCAVLEVKGSLNVRGDLDVFGDGSNEALVDIHQNVIIEAANVSGSIEGMAVIGDGADHGRIKIGNTLTIQANAGRTEIGVLDVTRGWLELTMANASSPQHYVGGNINLTTEDARMLFLDDADVVAYNDGTNDIAGEILGKDDGVEFQVTGVFTLGENMVLSGAMTILPESGSADFVNLGIVQANDPFGGTLSLGESLNVSDGDTAPYGQWKANAQGATLEFNESTELNGNFKLTGEGIIRVTAGTSQDPKAVVTTGTVQPDPNTLAADGCIVAESNACCRYYFGTPDQVNVCDDELGVNCP